MKSKRKKSDKEKIQDVVSMYDSYRGSKSKTIKMWKRIRSLYNGTFWELFKKKVKEFTLIPDTNYIEYVVTAYVNSIYSGAYIPEAQAIDLNSVDSIDVVNSFLEYTWKTLKMKQRYTEWGENVTLYNMQPVKVFFEGDKTQLEDINPFSIFLDPSVKNFKEGEAIFISNEVNIYSLLKDERFNKKVKEILAKDEKKFFHATEINMKGPDYERHIATGNKTVSVIEYYIKKEGKITNGFVMNREYLLHETDLLVEDFPIEILYQRKPNGDPYGVPLVHKIINSYITLNLLDSMEATQPYMALNRPKFFDLRSRINPRAFIDYGNVPGSTFPLFGDPSKAIHYQDTQFIPDATNIKRRIQEGIFDITGVDPAYKGRQTNSITTTGGVQSQQARVIMLTDNAPLVALESFVEALAKQMLDVNILNNEDAEVDFGGFLREEIKTTFKELKDKEIGFLLESKPYLPTTKETLYETLVRLYEMQGQYGFQVPLLQEEDLVEELPVSAIKKAKLKQRLANKKEANASMKRRETLMTFANLFQQMTGAGLDEETAATEALNIMDEESRAMEEDPKLGSNAQMMPPEGGMPMG